MAQNPCPWVEDFGALTPASSIFRTSTLMFDDSYTKRFGLKNTKINNVRKAFHKRSSDITLKNHPLSRHCRNPQYLLLKLIEKRIPQSFGTSIIVFDYPS